MTNTELAMPDNVRRWPLALREAWIEGYEGRPMNKDGRLSMERYRGAYWDGTWQRRLDDRYTSAGLDTWTKLGDVAPVSILSLRDPRPLDEMVEAWARFRAECKALGIRGPVRS